MPRPAATRPLTTVSVSEFKARCLSLLDQVRQTGQSLLITRRGDPLAEVVPPSGAATGRGWLGSAAGTGRIVGDTVRPVAGKTEWEATRR